MAILFAQLLLFLLPFVAALPSAPVKKAGPLPPDEDPWYIPGWLGVRAPRCHPTTPCSPVSYRSNRPG